MPLISRPSTLTQPGTGMARSKLVQAVTSLLVVFMLALRTAIAQAPVDSALARYINGIRAIDNHAHPMRPIAPGAPADSEFDALPLDGIPPFPVPARLTGTDAIWKEAQTALYGAFPVTSDSLYK